MITNQKYYLHDFTAVAGLISVLPIIYFVSLNVLKYELGLLSDIEIYSFHPAILLGGGSIAILLNLWSILEFRVSRQGEKLWFSLGFTIRPWNITILSLATLFFIVLVSYVILENIVHALGS